MAAPDVAEADGVVTFYGGIANDRTILVPGQFRVGVVMQHPYPCGCVGLDHYQRLGNIAVFFWHEPPPEHDDSEAWKRHGEGNE